MAPTEAKILNNYLLVPAQLPAIISLQEFVALFPRPLQSSPQVRSLYRDLQSQRNALVDSVASEIEDEVKRGKALRRAVIKTKREAEAQEYDDEVEIERMLFGDAPNARIAKHTINTIIPDLESAVSELEGELERFQQEEATLLASVQQTVGNLSDLRYGRPGNSQLREQVLDGLVDLQETCKAKK
ncbi:Cnl2/NKP2 family protein-domain-containing protein [Podospora aff. communis PSN243]|uniref:Cnl2/NKP2 family protein-domain-containing protein n=1 Tax=Podospora aff. communis PSN243 TaxID=3040156 RepID=A0AAV9H3F0_9PEZI|nr:Cnl2/NKP2 family protein-domain-containing protein [Podospora aff. communis PSN243]